MNKKVSAKYIVNYMTDTDMYKFTMMQAYLHHCPNEKVVWKWKCRSKGVDLTKLITKIRAEINHVCKLRFQQFELDWFRNGPQHDLFSEDFIDYLERFQLNAKYFNIGVNSNHELEITAEGPILQTTLFEIYTMQIIQELYMRTQNIDLEKARKNRAKAVNKLNKATKAGMKFRYADFGGRRRYSFDWQDETIGYMVKNCLSFSGTSNVYFAIKYGITAIGTYAHEMYAVYQGMRNVRLSEAQRAVFDVWTKEYRGNLGIALSDNFGFRAFLNDFDLYYAKLFDGCRHDSGNPFKWGDMLIEHYKKLRIDPRTKVACFSDSLDVEKMIDLAAYFNDRILVTFGVGTYFMATITGGSPISMVMKIVKCNGYHVVKLSDAIGKCMCENQSTIDYTMDVYQYRSIDERLFGDPVPCISRLLY